MTTIRTEQPADYRRVEEITREAFWNLYLPGGSEHYLVHTMRTHQDYMPELSCVIEEDGEIVGSIHFTRAKVVAPAGEEIPLVHFGPVSITPRLHRQGYGRRLITHAIDSARAQGHRAIVLGGFPYHYHPYGFAGTKKFGITMTDGKFYTGIMALPLYEGALDGVRGKLVLSDALEPDESGLAAFDSTFPPMEKKVLPCQKDFEIASAELDEREYLDGRATAKESSMKFAFATLYVNDMEKSVHFYNEILEIPITRRHPIGNGKELVFLGIDGEPNLELIPTEEKTAYTGFSIGFSVDNMAAVREKLKTHHYDVEREGAPGEGPKICFFNGPNGEKIELIEL